MTDCAALTAVAGQLGLGYASVLSPDGSQSMGLGLAMQQQYAGVQVCMASTGKLARSSMVGL